MVSRGSGSPATQSWGGRSGTCRPPLPPDGLLDVGGHYALLGRSDERPGAGREADEEEPHRPASRAQGVTV
jgi:hypothetical protein